MRQVIYPNPKSSPYEEASHLGKVMVLSIYRHKAEIRRIHPVTTHLFMLRLPSAKSEKHGAA
jgi:hypothetical protein